MKIKLATIWTLAPFLLTTSCSDTVDQPKTGGVIQLQLRLQGLLKYMRHQ